MIYILDDHSFSNRFINFDSYNYLFRSPNGYQTFEPTGYINKTNIYIKFKNIYFLIIFFLSLNFDPPGYINKTQIVPVNAVNPSALQSPSSSKTSESGGESSRYGKSGGGRASQSKVINELSFLDTLNKPIGFVGILTVLPVFLVFL